MQLRKLLRVALPLLLIGLVTAIGLNLNEAQAETNDGQKIYYYLNDHLGSVDAVLDEDGKVLERRDYLPYGSERLTFGDADEANGFTGKELDEETGLNYFEARYYDSSLGRFLSPDPILFNDFNEDNGLKRLVRDPQQLNQYSYARNNPVSLKDSTGQYVETAIDLIFLSISTRDFYASPGLGTAAWMGLDLIGTSLPVPSIPSYIKNSGRVAKIYKYFKKVHSRTGKGISQISETLVKNSFFNQTRKAWSKGEAGDSLANLVGHFELHSAETGAKNVKDYYNKANDFMDNSSYKWIDARGGKVHFDPKSKLTVVENNGDIASFYEVTKEKKLAEYMKKVKNLDKAK